MQRIQVLCWDYGLSFPADVQALHAFLKDTLVALDLSRYGAKSLVEHKEYEANKVKLEESVKASES